jgi:hypothetical protein
LTSYNRSASEPKPTLHIPGNLKIKIIVQVSARPVTQLGLSGSVSLLYEVTSKLYLIGVTKMIKDYKDEYLRSSLEVSGLTCVVSK